MLKPQENLGLHFVPVIPNGITHDFVVLTNKKAQTAFSPFGFTVLATLRVAHNFLRFTNEETSSFTVHRRRCGASGNRTRDLFHAMEARYQLRYSPESHVLPSQACSVGTK